MIIISPNVEVFLVQPRTTIDTIGNVLVRRVCLRSIGERIEHQRAQKLVFLYEPLAIHNTRFCACKLTQIEKQQQKQQQQLSAENFTLQTTSSAHIYLYSPPRMNIII